MAIRTATSANVTALGRLGALLVATHNAFDPDCFIAPTPGMERAYGDFLGRELHRDNAIVLVAEEAGVVVGYVYAGLEGSDYMTLRGPAGVVYDLIVVPERRRQGLGRLLLEAALKALVARGAPQVVLSTADRNLDAQRLFARAAFRRTMVEMTWEPGRGE